ncbi:adenylate/guanylate cyclase family protein [Mycobacteroides abscessus subsp. abscessus]|nr:adenylate/guanylate cyclase family protein [Mycobacteroides abscessus subsp. abscessus]
MNDRDVRSRDGTGQPTIDELVDRAVMAANRGDHAAASSLAEQVLAVDKDNADAEDLLTAPVDGGELRRLTIMFVDLVDSTVLSTQIEPEVYRTVVGHYRDRVRQGVERYDGHIASTKGDGLLAVFGHPHAHEDDARRAVQAGLDISRAVARLSQRVRKQFGFDIAARVGIHHGLVYLDIVQDDVYGLAANLTARVSSLAPAGSVVVSNAIQRLVRHSFDLQPLPAQHVKGIENPVEHHLVVGESAPSSRLAKGPIVGRVAELAHLQSCWLDAQHDRLTVNGVGFAGEPGIGKSRLATAAADFAVATGAPVLALLGSPFHSDSGLHPVRTLLEDRCGITRETPEADRLALLEDEIAARAMDTARYLPLFAPVLGISETAPGYQPASADARTLYSRIRRGLCDYLLACLGDGPGVVLAEDMHWFDESTIDLVRALLDAGSGRLLVVLTARHDTQLTPFADAGKARIFALTPLTAAESDELMSALDESLSRTQRAEIGRRCDGVPLYIEEVVTKHTQRLIDSSQWSRVPDVLYEPLFARLQADENVLPLLAAAAAIGRDVTHSLLARVANLPDDQFATALGELTAARVLINTAPNRWRFRHELLREVAAELAPPSQRRRLHGRIADALTDVATATPDWNAVGVHCELAERFAQAAKAFRHAAHDARARGATVEAHGQLTRALSNIERLPEGNARERQEAGIRLRRGFLMSAIAGPTSAEAAADFERCLELGGSSLTVESQATLQALVGYFLSRGDMRRSALLLETGRVLSAEAPAWMREANTAGFATMSWYRGDFITARTELENLTAAHNEVDSTHIETAWFIPHEPVASLHTLLAMARFVQGDLPGMQAALDATEARCAMLGFPHGPFSLAYARSIEMWMRYESGQPVLSAQCVDSLAGLARRHGFDSWQLLAGAERALIDGVVVRTDPQADPKSVDAQIINLDNWIQAQAALEIKPFLCVYSATAAGLLMKAGRMPEARERLDAALGLTDQLEARFYDAELLRLRAHTHDGQDRRSDLAASYRLATQQGATVFRLRAAIDLFELDPDTRQELVDTMALLPQDSDWPEIDRARALLG